jgi:hypothetical protein
MPRPRGNNVKPSFGLTFKGDSNNDVPLGAKLNSSPYYPQRIHLIDVGTYVLEFEAIPRSGKPRHTLAVTLSTYHPLTLDLPAVKLLATDGVNTTTDDVQLVAEY